MLLKSYKLIKRRRLLHSRLFVTDDFLVTGHQLFEPKDLISDKIN